MKRSGNPSGTIPVNVFINYSDTHDKQNIHNYKYVAFYARVTLVYWPEIWGCNIILKNVC